MTSVTVQKRFWEILGPVRAHPFALRPSLRRMRRMRRMRATGPHTLTEFRAAIGHTLRVAVIRVDGIGDWTMTLPLLVELRESPDVESVALVGPPEYRPLLERSGFDYISFSMPTVHAPFFGLAGEVKRLKALSAWGEMSALKLGWMSRGKFDLVIVARREGDAGFNARAWAIGTGAAIVGHDPHGAFNVAPSELRESRLLDVCVRVPEPVKHEVEYTRGLVRALGLPSDFKELGGSRFFDAAWQPRSGARRLAIHASASAGRKEWPVESWRKLVERLLESDPSLQIRLVGSSSDLSEHDAVQKDFEANVSSWAGVLPFSELPGLLASVDLFIGGDSGPGHVAAAVGTPTITISHFPLDGDPTLLDRAERWRPWGNHGVLIQPETNLPPCHGFCDQGEAHCITQVSVDQVFEAVQTLYEPSPHGS